MVSANRTRTLPSPAIVARSRVRTRRRPGRRAPRAYPNTALRSRLVPTRERAPGVGRLELRRRDRVHLAVVIGEGGAIEAVQLVVQDAAELQIQRPTTGVRRHREIQLHTLGFDVERHVHDLETSAVLGLEPPAIDLQFDRVQHDRCDRLVHLDRHLDPAHERRVDEVGFDREVVPRWHDGARKSESILHERPGAYRDGPRRDEMSGHRVRSTPDEPPTSSHDLAHFLARDGPGLGLRAVFRAGVRACVRRGVPPHRESARGRSPDTGSVPPNVGSLGSRVHHGPSLCVPRPVGDESAPTGASARRGPGPIGTTRAGPRTVRGRAARREPPPSGRGIPRRTSVRRCPWFGAWTCRPARRVGPWASGCLDPRRRRDAERLVEGIEEDPDPPLGDDDDPVTTSSRRSGGRPPAPVRSTVISRMSRAAAAACLHRPRRAAWCAIVASRRAEVANRLRPGQPGSVPPRADVSAALDTGSRGC